MVIKAGQINVGRSANAMAEIRRHLDSHKTQILSIQEPYLQHHANWPGCKLFYGAGLGEEIWSLTLIRDPTLTVVLNSELLSDKYCTALNVVPPGKDVEFVIVNSYFKYNEMIEPHIDTLERILDFYQEKFVIITAGINAKTYMWHNEVDDERGQKFEPFILTRDIQISNVKSKLTTFENVRGHKSNIDVTISTVSRKIDVINGCIQEQSFLTDHRLITFDIIYRDNRTSPAGLYSPWGKAEDYPEARRLGKFRRSVECRLGQGCKISKRKG